MPSTNSPAAAAALLSATAVRQRCNLVLAAAERGETRHFRLVLDRLPEIAGRVAAVTCRRYPGLEIPIHSRWRHFAAGGIDRAALVAADADPTERARAMTDLAIVSVLLDAGAGPDWQYREKETGLVLSRSEGLAVASLRAMQQGLFSADPQMPWRADADALAMLDPAVLALSLQHGLENPLAGIEGRALLLRRLGETAAAAPGLFGRPARLAGLIAHWRPYRRALPAPEILATLLRALGPIWPGRLSLGGMPLGDCGRHPAVPGDGLVPFHKLSQWLAYSLFEPLAMAGFTVTESNGLTGLAEYRNGGLFLDGGVVEWRDPGLARTPLDPYSEPVVEWRALTVALLDRLLPQVRAMLGLDAAALSLAAMLEGGSWAAGREIARERRADGGPPLAVVSDGTVF